MAAIRPRRRSDGGTSYTVRWRLGGARDGAWQSETFHARQPARDFKADVEDAGHQWPQGWVKGAGYVRVADEPAAPAQPRLVTELGREYVDQLTGVGPDTKSDYVGMIDRLAAWLEPIVGAAPTVEGLEKVHVRTWVNTREAAGAAPKTIRNYHGLLFSVMEYAIEEAKLRADNPCRKTRLPEPDGFDDEDGTETITFLDEAEFDLIHEEMGFDPDAQDFLTAKVGTGARFSELTAVECRDVKLDTPIPYVWIYRAWKRNGRGDHAIAGKGRRYRGKPKSKAGRRRVTLAPVVADAFRRQMAGKAPTDLVFTGPQGGAMRHSHFYNRRWLKAVRAAQQRGLAKSPRLHDLRHTHAAWLISANVPLPVIQQRLGHKSIAVTVDVYGGLLIQAQQAADAAIEAALTGRHVPAPTSPKVIEIEPMIETAGQEPASDLDDAA
ncbi:MAG TPA: site-specific integrase [Frankiaceae bacterium]|nr:site-specific integrase [Frankiaceae bacterium]